MDLAFFPPPPTLFDSSALFFFSLLTFLKIYSVHVFLPLFSNKLALEHQCQKGKRKDKHKKFEGGNYFAEKKHEVFQKLSWIRERALSRCPLPCLKSEQMPLLASHLFGHVQGHPMVFVWYLFACFNSVADWVDENLVFSRDLPSPTDLLPSPFPFPRVCFYTEYAHSI